MRDAHLLGLALLAAIAPACKAPHTGEAPSAAPPTATTPTGTATETSGGIVTTGTATETSGGIVTTTPDPTGAEAEADCAGAELPEPADHHTVQFADGTAQVVARMSEAEWQAAAERLITECRAIGPQASCPDTILPAAELLCRAAVHHPDHKECVSTLYNQGFYGDAVTQGLAWQLSCDWVILQVDAQTAAALSRSEIMEGRPLTAEGGPVLPAILGTDTPVAVHWLQMAAAELASVHSFLRHGDELRSLGAPESLIDAVQDAARDEARHAALCIGLAGEGSLGPMPPVPAPRRGAAAILGAVLVEGCINETISALIARRSASTSTEPARAEILHRIADDEARHAALAWRTLAWGLRRHAELVPALQTALHDAIRSLKVRESDIVGDGILTAEQGRAAARDAITSAILPAWAACTLGLQTCGEPVATAEACELA